MIEFIGFLTYLISKKRRKISYCSNAQEEVCFIYNKRMVCKAPHLVVRIFFYFISMIHSKESLEEWLEEILIELYLHNDTKQDYIQTVSNSNNSRK